MQFTDPTTVKVYLFQVFICLYREAITIELSS